MWRGVPTLKDEGFELLLDNNWIKKGWGQLLLCGPWTVGDIVIQEFVSLELWFAPMFSFVCSCAGGGRGGC